MIIIESEENYLTQIDIRRRFFSAINYSSLDRVSPKITVLLKWTEIQTKK